MEHLIKPNPKCTVSIRAKNLNYHPLHPKNLVYLRPYI